MVIHSHIISIQLRHQNCCYAVIRAWNLPDEIIVLKNIDERNSGDIKTTRRRIEVHVVRRELTRREYGANDLPGIRIENDYFCRVTAVNGANKQAMLRFV